MNRDDPFVGTWALNAGKSTFPPAHSPTQATMRFERDETGYRMFAEGAHSDGHQVVERPQRFITDGDEYPVPGAPGVTSAATSPDPNTIDVVARKDGQIVGEARYAVSADGTTLTATVRGTDGQQRPFQTVVVCDRS